MGWIDYLIIGIILVSSAIGTARGFIKEVLSVLSWGLALWVAFTFYVHVAILLTDYVVTPSLRSFLAFFILFIVTLILATLVNHFVSQLVEKTGLTGTDRSLGVVFGLIRGLAIVTLLVLFAGTTPMIADSWWQNSLLLEHFEKAAVWVRTFLPYEIAKYISFS